jgi:hypothetical protein
MSGALQAVFQNQRSFGPPPGQQVYTSGNNSWVAPAGVTSVSVLAVASGRSGDFFADGSGGYTLAGYGGCLSYKNNYTVVPGNSYTAYLLGGNVYFVSEAVLRANDATNRVGDGGGDGGTQTVASNSQPQMGGSGAGGYAGSGGKGGLSVTGASGAGGGGGAGSSSGGRGGGGVGILGQGSSGAGGTSGNRGDGGSGGVGGGTSVNGGNYGGGGGTGSTPESGTAAGSGAIRIIWPGTTRQFPSTNTGDL